MSTMILSHIIIGASPLIHPGIGAIHVHGTPGTGIGPGTGAGIGVGDPPGHGAGGLHGRGLPDGDPAVAGDRPGHGVGLRLFVQTDRSVTYAPVTARDLPEIIVPVQAMPIVPVVVHPMA